MSDETPRRVSEAVGEGAPPAGENGSESAAAAAAAAVAGEHVAPENNVANDTGSANAPQPDEAAAAAGGGPPPNLADNEAELAAGGEAPPPLRASLASDLSAYFTNLSTTLSRTLSNDNSATGMIRSPLVSLLWEGVSPIVAAAGSEFGRGHLFLSFEGLNVGGGDGSNREALITPQQAALYLYAVSQNIVALEAAVLGSNRPPNVAAAAGGAGGGGMLDGWGGGENNANGNVLGGGVTAKHVAEIVSAASIVATFCNSRSIITQSGIVPALLHLIESTSTVSLSPSALNGSKSHGKSDTLHSLTPFHADFLQVSLLAGQYRYAASFLATHPMSHMTLNFPYLRIDPTTYLRTQYYAGLVHVGCNDWNSALDSFHLCLTMPCSAVSAVQVAARKKSLLVQCMLLESEELDGNTATGNSTKVNAQSRIASGGSGGRSKSALESKVLELPGAASAAVSKHMTASSNRVGGGSGSGAGSGTAPDRSAGSETSEQPPPGGRSRRRVRSNRSDTSSDAGGGERGERGQRGGGGGESKAKSVNQAALGCYHELVSAYISGNASHYAKLLKEMTDLLHVDGNWGLAKQLEGRLLAYRSVRKVASIYSVVGADVLEKKLQDVGPSGGIGKRGIEDMLMGMAACDAKDPLIVDPFVTKIDHSTNMVSFFGDEDDDSDDEEGEQWMEADLSSRLQSCIALAERVRDLDIALTTSPKYQQQVLKENRSAAAMLKQQGQQGGASVADIGGMDIGADW